MTLLSRWTIPRNALIWVLLAQCLVIAPQTLRLPFWVLLVFVVAVVWRLMVYRGQWATPGTGIKALLALIAGTGVIVNYGHFYAVEPTVALLVAGFSLKLLELDQRRDVYLLLFLGYFVVATEFLFSQDLLITLYVLVVAWVLTTALVAVHQQPFIRFSYSSARKAASILLQAIPLMLVLYLFFPRFSPLWQVPLPSHQAKTGISESFSPGDISQLSRSDELAFRVQFDGPVPPLEQLYWRGMVMSEFDGRRWSLVNSSRAEVVRPEMPEGEPINYTVTQEASYQPWLFGLAPAYSDDPQLLSVYGGVQRYHQPIHERIRYQLSSYPAMSRGLSLPTMERQRELQLPVGGNPKTRQLVRQLYRQAGNDEAYMRAILDLFRQQPFYYSLTPPLLGEQSIDDFLFSSREGFCGHYAGAFVYMMRAAGIVARVVTGYQGGEINPVNRTVLVHQFDAHAWAEVWLAGQGWRRVDPTAAVSPARIEQGIEQAVESEFLAESPLSLLKYRHFSWLNRLRLQWDALDYYWHSWVLQYRGEQQYLFLEKLLGKLTTARLLMVFTVVLMLLLLPLLLHWLLQKKKQQCDPAQRLYNKFCNKLAALGFPRGEAEGPLTYARRLAVECPQHRATVDSATRAFISLNYQVTNASQRRALLALLKRELASL